MTAALKIQGLSKKFEGFALDKVSFQVPSGSIVGLIGENGAGKTTTINAALGLIKKDSGEIELFGENVQIAAASHDLFAKRVNGQIYRPLLEKYIL